MSAAEAGRISRFREDTRDERIAIAREAEHRYGRKVAWGAVCGGTRQLFTTLSAPVMTRLRQPERQVLDTLVDAGVARSRSEALAWCVRLVGEHAEQLADRAARGDGRGRPAARRRARTWPEPRPERDRVVAAAGPRGSRGMRAAVFEGPGNIRIQHVPDPEVELPTDAVVRVVSAGLCGTDLWAYRGYGQRQPGERIGHEFIGVVTDVGPDVRTVRPGDLVISPFTWSDGTCEYCLSGLTTSCVDGGVFGEPGHDGAQGEAVRVPHADGTLVVVPPALRDAAPELLLPLCDVLPTGHHAARSAGVEVRATGSWSSATARSGCARCWPPAGSARRASP